MDRVTILLLLSEDSSLETVYWERYKQYTDNFYFPKSLECMYDMNKYQLDRCVQAFNRKAFTLV